MGTKKNNNQRILIVEDDFHSAKILKINLEKEGFEVDVAADGKKALDKLNLSIPDLIISDIMMPELDGIAFRNQLLLNPEHRIIPFIFLTAKNKSHQKIAGYKLFVDGYVVKPYEFPELLAQIKAILQKQKYYNDLIKFDGLTRLYNRKTFFSALERELTRSMRYNSKISFAIFDLDQFKQCNDQYGHTFGDYVLIRVADILSSSLRGTDFAGRYGGEEFLVTMLNTNKDNAFKVVERLRQSISSLEFDIPDFTITTSAGIATFHEDGATIDDLMKAADKALYAAKESGRNKTVLANVQPEFDTLTA